LALLVEAGLTPMEALQAATINPARWLGVEKTLGPVKRGKIADLILLDANPLDDIHNTQKIDAVVANGKLIPKPELHKELHKMLANVEAQARK
jgi:imidazolonepropionase-like amidohydrolase